MIFNQSRYVLLLVSILQLTHHVNVQRKVREPNSQNKFAEDGFREGIADKHEAAREASIESRIIFCPLSPNDSKEYLP